MSDHEGLVAALEEMAQRNGWVLEVPTMEKMSKDEQFELAARTTVMVGVHGSESPAREGGKWN
jgi:predicted ATPase